MTGYYKRITDELAQDREQLRSDRLRDKRSGDFRYGRLLKRVLIGVAAFAVAAAAILYIGDYALLRYRVMAQKNAFDDVTVKPYYAMHLKSGRTEFSFQPDEQERCVNSLFPHLGMSPCWYLRRHPEKRTDI